MRCLDEPTAHIIHSDACAFSLGVGVNPKQHVPQPCKLELTCLPHIERCRMRESIDVRTCSNHQPHIYICIAVLCIAPYILRSCVLI